MRKEIRISIIYVKKDIYRMWNDELHCSKTYTADLRMRKQITKLSLCAVLDEQFRHIISSCEIHKLNAVL